MQERRLTKRWNAAELSAMPFEEGFHKAWLMWLETPEGKAYRERLYQAISKSNSAAFFYAKLEDRKPTVSHGGERRARRP